MELMFALSSCAIMLHTMGMRYMCWSPSYGTQTLRDLRDVGIVGGTHSYDWWAVACEWDRCPWELIGIP